MKPQPESKARQYLAANKLAGKVALITGGDSGIGRSVAVAFAKEGADVAIVYLEEHEDANGTKRLVEAAGTRCLLIAGDVGDEKFCEKTVKRVVKELGGLNIVVNNAAEQHVQPQGLAKITAKQLLDTFRTNVFSMFYLAKAALPYLKEGDAIINSTSVTAYRGSPHLIDYSATKGAIVSFTRSLSKSLVDKNIRVTFPISFKFPNYQDSLQAWDLSNTQNAFTERDRYRYSLRIPISIDTAERTFSFTLKAGHEVTVLGQPTSLSTIKNTSVIADSDTLKYMRQNGCWIYSIR